MAESHPFKETLTHHGIVVDTSTSGFDSHIASFGSVFVDEEDPHTLFFYYAGGQNERVGPSSIGLATSRDGLKFRKENKNPVLAAPTGSFCHAQAITPAVTKVSNRFYMVLAGKPSLESARRIGIAYADDPRGPWQIIGELIKPAQFWEGNGIDNGPSIAKIDKETILVYYSSITSPKVFDIATTLRRYPIRRIGILKVRILGIAPSQIEAMRFSDNPLKHLNGAKGSWNESVFCPGYIKLNGTHHLFPTGSTYSTGSPPKQHIGIVTGNSAYFQKKTSHATKLVDGPSEKTKIIPNIKSEIALDTPSPHIDVEKRKLFLYYSVADRTDEAWKTALTTFDLKR